MDKTKLPEEAMIFGAIVGDVIGSAYEWHNTKDYNFELFTPQSNYTDDSFFTCAIASQIIRDKKLTHQKVAEALCDYFYTHGDGRILSHCGGGFKTWLINPKGLRTYKSDDEKPLYELDGRHPYGSWGNGSAMRVSPVGWAYDSLEETEEMAKITAEVTHNHPEGIKGAQATAAAIYLARTGKSKEEIRNYIESKYGYDLHKTWKYWHPIYKWDSSCQGTVPQAIICFLDSENFIDSIRKAVSLGGDSDTLAAITGSIAEAYYQEYSEDFICKMMRYLFSPDMRAFRELYPWTKQSEK